MDKEVQLTTSGLIAKSNKEVYLVLTTEGGLYQSPIEDANKTIERE